MFSGLNIEQKYLAQWMTLKFQQTHVFSDNAIKDQRDSCERYGREVDDRLLDHMLRYEDEEGILGFCRFGGKTTGPSAYSYATLMKIARYGYANMLLLEESGASKDHQALEANQGPKRLHSACERDLPNQDVLKEMVLRMKFDVNATDSEGHHPTEESALHVLSRSRLWWKAYGIEFLAEHGADLNARDKAGHTPLWRAVQAKATKNIKMLLECGADPNIPNHDGITCLNIAESSDVVHLLLDHGASPSKGEYPFMFDAIKSLDNGIVSKVAQTGVDWNVPSKSKPGWLTGHTQRQSYLRGIVKRSDDVIYPIHLAASHIFASVEERSKAAQIIDLLLQHGANVLLECSPGNSIIHALCECGGDIEPFLDRINVEERDAQGNTLLLASCQQKPDSAAAKCSAVLINLLLGRGASMEALNSTNQSVLHILLSHDPGHADIKSLKDGIEVFVGRVAITKIINQTDTSGRTPLLVAARNGHCAAVPILLSAGADPFKTDDEDNNVLHCLAPYLFPKQKYSMICKPSLQHIDIFKTLLALGISVNASNHSGETPLHIAFQKGFITMAMIQLFIETGADFKAVDGEGRNLLHLMASTPWSAPFDPWLATNREHQPKEEDEVWRALIDRGGIAYLDPSKEDYQQRSIWDLASACGNNDVLAKVESRI